MKIANFVILDKVYNIGDTIEDAGISLLEILHLQALGFLQGVGANLGNAMNPKQNKDGFLVKMFISSDQTLFISSEKDYTLRLPVIMITSIGQEILK